jgi:hypothetical protein
VELLVFSKDFTGSLSGYFIEEVDKVKQEQGACGMEIVIDRILNELVEVRGCEVV